MIGAEILDLACGKPLSCTEHRRGLHRRGHAFRIGNSFAGDIKSAPMSDRHADVRHAEMDGGIAIEPPRLHGDMALVVIERNNAVESALRRWSLDGLTTANFDLTRPTRQLPRRPPLARMVWRLECEPAQFSILTTFVILVQISRLCHLRLSY